MASMIQLLGFLVLYLLLRTVYRLLFHPLAKFPGPRLAAITSMYAAYYDLPVETSFCKEMPRLHDRYGPIVRTRPNELHIRDMDSFNQWANSPAQQNWSDAEENAEFISPALHSKRNLRSMVLTLLMDPSSIFTRPKVQKSSRTCTNRIFPKALFNVLKVRSTRRWKNCLLLCRPPPRHPRSLIWR